jgi:RNA polymerase sigma-32 factor
MGYVEVIGRVSMSRHALPALTGDTGFQNYMQEIQRFPMLSADEEYSLAKRWTEDGDVEAAHRLVTSHLRLVAKIAMGFRGYGLPITDIVAEGNIGLMQAVKKFDPEKGFRLSTYAMWWIKASIQEYVLKSWSLVKVGVGATQKRLFFNLKRLKSRLNAVDGNQLTPEQITDIANELGVAEQEVVAMDQRMSAHDRYLDSPVGDEDGSNWIDLMEGDDAGGEMLLLEKQEQSRNQMLLETGMDALNERERDIIRGRRLSDDVITLEDLSQKHGISRERVRQIEVRAMEKLSYAIKQKALESH